MTDKRDHTNFRQRLADFAARFEEPSRPGSTRDSRRDGTRTLESVFGGLRDLFTQGVTGEEIRNLFERDARDAFRFYARGVDFDSLRPLPWYKRYPTMAWKVFAALAYKLNPARRIAFALATFFFLLGWIELLVSRSRAGTEPANSAALWLAASFLLFFLLLFLELRDKLDLKGDLEIAREIQFGLVPNGPFFRNGIDIHCFMRPANTVGGDYYDIIELDDGRIAVIIGDVAGKGMPAALLMALLQGSLRTLLTAGHRGADLTAKLNVYLCSNIPENRLVTLFYGELDTLTGELLYVNAGHNPPLLLRNGDMVERLASTSMVLGVDPNPAFITGKVMIAPGERLLLYTDGISEAFNLQEEEYGEARVAAFLQSNAASPPLELVQGIVADVLKFCGAARISDDMTLMAIARRRNVPAAGR